MNNTINTQKIIIIIKKAGQEIMKIYNLNNFDIKNKIDNSPITIADKKSNEIICKGLSQFDIPILSEESNKKIDLEKTEMIWIIDPLDGTLDFIQKTGEFCIMIGLVENGLPIMGFVYIPEKDILYYGIKNKGAYKIQNNKKTKLQVSKVNTLDKARLIASKNHFSDNIQNFYITNKIKKLVKCGSNGIKIGLIAENKADIFINPTDKMGKWDTCAPHIILQEAGGKITDINGNQILYNTKKLKNSFGIVATNAKIHNNVIKNFKS